MGYRLVAAVVVEVVRPPIVLVITKQKTMNRQRRYVCEIQSGGNKIQFRFFLANLPVRVLAVVVVNRSLHSFVVSSVDLNYSNYLFDY